MCYGGVRLSEDLNFTGGMDFSRKSLAVMGKTLTETLKQKYGLKVVVNEPEKDIHNVDTWKIKIETRPEQKHLPVQRINIDICTITSFEKRPMLLLNPYGVDMGTGGLVIQAQSREEIFADKLLALALRPNKIKHRDLWDMVWLHQQGLKPHFQLIPNKLQERHLTPKHFIDSFRKRQKLLITDKKLELEFKNEMQRFLPVDHIKILNKTENIWGFIVYLIEDLANALPQYVDQ